MDDGIDQNERGRQRPSAVTHSLGDAGDEIGPGAGAAQVKIVGPHAQFVGMGRSPQPSRQDVVGGNRVVHTTKCLAIVERQHGEPSRRQCERHPVRLEHVEIAADEGSAMDPHQPRAALLGTSIDASGDVTVEPVNHRCPEHRRLRALGTSRGGPSCSSTQVPARHLATRAFPQSAGTPTSPVDRRPADLRRSRATAPSARPGASDTGFTVLLLFHNHVSLPS